VCFKDDIGCAFEDDSGMDFEGMTGKRAGMKKIVKNETGRWQKWQKKGRE
jgi:hypothetical protein